MPTVSLEALFRCVLLCAVCACTSIFVQYPALYGSNGLIPRSPASSELSDAFHTARRRPEPLVQGSPVTGNRSTLQGSHMEVTPAGAFIADVMAGVRNTAIAVSARLGTQKSRSSIPGGAVPELTILALRGRDVLPRMQQYAVAFGGVHTAADFGTWMMALLLAAIVASTAAVLVPSVALCSPVALFVAVVYGAVVADGETFLHFQWDALLIEALAIAAVSLPLLPPRLSALPSTVRAALRPDDATVAAEARAGFMGTCTGLAPRYTLRVVAVKLMFMSGVVKLRSECPTWQQLTANHYHYGTQCIPTPLAWYAAQLPDAAQRWSIATVFLVQIWGSLLLAVPWSLVGEAMGAAAALLLCPWRGARATIPWLVRRVLVAVDVALVVLHVAVQVGILLTGHYTFFNAISIGLLCAALPAPAADAFFVWCGCKGPLPAACHTGDPNRKWEPPRTADSAFVLRLLAVCADIVACFAVFLALLCFGFLEHFSIDAQGGVGFSHTGGDIFRTLRASVVDTRAPSRTSWLGGVGGLSDLLLAAFVACAARDVAAHIIHTTGPLRRCRGAGHRLAHVMASTVRMMVSLPLFAARRVALLLVVSANCAVLAAAIVPGVEPSLWLRAALPKQYDAVAQAAEQSVLRPTVSGYGLFQRMTGVGDAKGDGSRVARPEVVVELHYASVAACRSARRGTKASGWVELDFRFKPGVVERSPPLFVAPHQPRLDWQMWFAALGQYPPGWLLHLVHKTLRTDLSPEAFAADRADRLQSVMSLVGAAGPGSGAAWDPAREFRALVGPQVSLAKAAAGCDLPSGLVPDRARAFLYHYRFTARRNSTRWWRRSKQRHVLPDIDRRNPQLAKLAADGGWSTARAVAPSPLLAAVVRIHDALAVFFQW